MISFKLNIRYNNDLIFERKLGEYTCCVEALNQILDDVYNLHSVFGDKVFRTELFTYTIEEVCEQ